MPKLFWINDPGHSWLAVPLAAYPDALDYGTGYGYLDGNYAYLEEDCEAPLFLKFHPEVNGRNLPEVEMSPRNKRNLPAGKVGKDWEIHLFGRELG